MTRCRRPIRKWCTITCREEAEDLDRCLNRGDPTIGITWTLARKQRTMDTRHKTTNTNFTYIHILRRNRNPRRRPRRKRIACSMTNPIRCIGCTIIRTTIIRCMIIRRMNIRCTIIRCTIIRCMIIRNMNTRCMIIRNTITRRMIIQACRLLNRNLK